MEVRQEHWNARIGAVESGGMAAVRESVVGRFLSEGLRARQPETTRWVGDMIEATNPEGYIEACCRFTRRGPDSTHSQDSHSISDRRGSA
jgi:hypothetical protein